MVGCGEVKVHENVNEDLANDSLQVMNIIEEAANSDTIIDDLADEDLMKLVGFQEKYHENDMLFVTFSEADENIITFTVGSSSKYSKSKLIDSDVKEFTENKEAIEAMIESGKPYLERND